MSETYTNKDLETICPYCFEDDCKEIINKNENIRLREIASKLQFSFEDKNGFNFSKENEIAIITNFQNPIKFQTFVEFKDLPEELKEAALICYDADFCDRLYDAAGDCLFDVTDQNQIERALDSGIFGEAEIEKLKTLLQFMQEFNIKFIQD
jgi:hypothetical protein